MAPKADVNMGIKSNRSMDTSIALYKQSDALSETQKIEGREECAKQWDAVDKRDSRLNPIFMPAQAENSQQCKKIWE